MHPCFCIISRTCSCTHRNKILKSICFESSSSIANWHGRINFRRSRRNTARATLKVPSTKAPATTLRTTGRIIARSGFTNTQGVSDSYSFSKKKISKSTPSIANDPKGTALKVETPALIEENDNTSATFNTTQWPATAVSVGNAYVSRNNDVNITRPAPSEASNVKISRNDNIANYSGQYKGQSHGKTQVRFLRTISVTSMSIHKFNLLQRSNITTIARDITAI